MDTRLFYITTKSSYLHLKNLLRRSNLLSFAVVDKPGKIASKLLIIRHHAAVICYSISLAFSLAAVILTCFGSVKQAELSRTKLQNQRLGLMSFIFMPSTGSSFLYKYHLLSFLVLFSYIIRCSVKRGFLKFN